MATGTTATQLSVDRPADGARVRTTEDLVVEGWAWAPGGEPTVTVSIADSHAVVRSGVWRPDVSSALGVDEHCGFDAALSLRRLPPGPAEIVVSATTADGDAVEVRRTVEVVALMTEPARPRPVTGPPERLDARRHAGTFTAAEHIARYRWAAQFVGGADVLDAASGLGYGARILRDAGASSVIGVDAFAGAVVEAREQAVDGLAYQLGDLRDLPFDADSFDIAVCFEAIEHVTERERVVSELKRVLRPEGVLAISTPIPGAVAVHNPHHVRELTPDELHRLLSKHFEHVVLHWQQTAVASLVDAEPLPGSPPTPSPPLGWTAGPLGPAYTVALAGDGALPEPAATGALAAGIEITHMVSVAVAQLDRVAALEAEVRALEARALRAEVAHGTASRQLAEARTAPAPVPPAPPAPPPPAAPPLLQRAVRLGAREGRRAVRAARRRWRG